MNTGLGEGVSYRARLLLAIRTEITDNVEICTDKNVELEETFPISESSYSKNEEFFLFSAILEASMLDKKLSDRPVCFELSMGNAGNSLDGQNESQCYNMSDDEEFGKNNEQDYYLRRILINEFGKIFILSFVFVSTYKM